MSEYHRMRRARRPYLVLHISMITLVVAAAAAFAR